LIRKLIVCLFNDKYKLSSELAFYEEVLKDCNFFSVSPQIYVLLKQRNLLHETPYFFQAALRRSYIRALSQNLLLRNETEQIYHAFEREKLDVIPLIGTGFVESFFGDIGGRLKTKLHFFVRIEDRERAADTLKLIGYAHHEGNKYVHGALTFSRTISYSASPYTVVLHAESLEYYHRRARLLSMERRIWERAIPLKPFVFVKQLSSIDTFHLITMNDWNKREKSFKYVLDILLVMERCQGKLDYASILSEASNMHNYRRMLKVLKIVLHMYPELPFVRHLCFIIPPRKRRNSHLFQNILSEPFRLQANRTFRKNFDYDTLVDGFRAFFRWN
jgi:hypothetical protein